MRQGAYVEEEESAVVGPHALMKHASVHPRRASYRANGGGRGKRQYSGYGLRPSLSQLRSPYMQPKFFCCGGFQRAGCAGPFVVRARAGEALLKEEGRKQTYRPDSWGGTEGLDIFDVGSFRQ